MAKKLFGTDGVRGIAGKDITPELAYGIGRACAELGEDTKRVVLGRDTRQSGSMLGAALAAGFCAGGWEVSTLGVAPTGAISYIARTGDYGLGVVISASHNPADDNGIKLLSHDGAKVPDAFERAIEELLEAGLPTGKTGTGMGVITPAPDEVRGYLEFLESLVPERLEGLTVVVDGSNGAGYELGPEILHRLGANVISLGVSPDGKNINTGCGATRPATLQAATKEHGADIGIAFDGDADRAVFADRHGRLTNGDRTMAIWARHWRPEPPVLVGTVMSNGGFEHYLEGAGMTLSRANVGDRNVAIRMRETGAKIGGEQSGHIIFAERGPTGDGLVTALEILRVLKREGRDLAHFYDEFENWPQVLSNLRVANKDGWEQREPVRAAIQVAESQLGESGRVSVRASGTQPVLRVMVEASEAGARDETHRALVHALLQELGGEVESEVDLTHALGD